MISLKRFAARSEKTENVGREHLQQHIDESADKRSERTAHPADYRDHEHIDRGGNTDRAWRDLRILPDQQNAARGGENDGQP